MKLTKSKLKALALSAAVYTTMFFGAGVAYAEEIQITELIPVAEEPVEQPVTKEQVKEEPVKEPVIKEPIIEEKLEEPVEIPVVPVPVVEMQEVVQAEITNHPHFMQKLENGNYLICRVGQENPGVFEVTPEGEEVWSYPDVIANSAIRLANGNTLIADSGVPGYPNPPRVMEVNKSGSIIWQYNLKSLAESPRYAERVENGNTLVTLPFEIRELNKGKSIVWHYGTGKPGELGNLDQLSNPVQANRLPNGNTLVVDEGINAGRVFEVTTAGDVVWDYREGLKKPKSATRLDNANTIIVDRRTDQMIEVDKNGEKVQAYSWQEAVKHLPVMNVWYGQYLPDNGLLLTMTLTNNAGRVLDLEFGDNIE